MKIRNRMIIVVIPVIVIMITACTGQATPSQSTAATPDKAQACLVQTGGAPAVDAAALIRDKLMSHHDTNRIYAARHTREEWNTTLDRMISRGASISDSEKQIIIDYLLCLQQ